MKKIILDVVEIVFTIKDNVEYFALILCDYAYFHWQVTKKRVKARISFHVPSITFSWSSSVLSSSSHQQNMIIPFVNINVTSK